MGNQKDLTLLEAADHLGLNFIAHKVLGGFNSNSIARINESVAGKSIFAKNLQIFKSLPVQGYVVGMSSLNNVEDNLDVLISSNSPEQMF